MRCALILLTAPLAGGRRLAVQRNSHRGNTPLALEHQGERIENEKYQERRAGGRTDHTLGRYGKQGCNRSERPEEKHH
jgi:hypothetical protein